MEHYLFSDENFVKILSTPFNLLDKDWNPVQLDFNKNPNWTYSLISDNANKVFSIEWQNNNIKDLDGIWNFTNLQWLDLSDNKIEVLSEELCNLVNLTDLIIVNNKIKLIPYYIKNLTNLQYLNLQGNDLKSLSDIMLELKNLKILILNHNNTLFDRNSLKILNKMKSLRYVDFDRPTCQDKIIVRGTI